MLIRKLIKAIIYILKKVKSLLSPKLNSYAEQILWKYRHIIIPKRMTDFGEHQGIRREQLVNVVKSKKPFKSLLDIGCGNGLNIDILSNEIPYSEFHGVDINKKVIETNQKRSKSKINCKYYVRNINDLYLFKKKSFDYVMTDSVLIYHGPDRIMQILFEFKRIASKGIILREQSMEKSTYKGHWIYNYSKLIDDLGIEKYQILKTYGQEGLWDKYGYIFDIEIGNIND